MNLNRYSQSAAQPGLAVESITILPIPIPSFEEQNQIAEYIEAQTSRIDEIIKKIQKRTELLDEYKKSLINHVVTGKIDVRQNSDKN